MSEIKIQKGISLERQPPTQADQKARLRDASKMYEEYFLNEMMKSMRKTVQHSELTEPTMAEKIYTEQLDNNAVEQWANRGGVGLADIIYNQLQDRFYNGGGAPKPQGPLPIEKGTRIKIDESKQYGIPVATPRTQPGEVSFLFEWDESQKPQSRDVVSPYDGDVIQMYRGGDDRQVIKIAHEDGMISTLSYQGQTKDLKLGDGVGAGQKLGQLSPYALGLTWQVGRVET